MTCHSLMELDWVAQEFGWYGWSEGPAASDFVIYRCRCPEEHTAYVANQADDPEYYERRAEYVRTCRTG